MTNVAEFEGWLKKGLGRAVVHLKTHDSKPYGEILLYACTHNLAYDSQCEGIRAEYLNDLIGAAGDEQYFRDGIAGVLVADIDTESVELPQTIATARTFAEQGDGEIRKIMYGALVRVGFERAADCYGELVALDGVEALAFACEQFPASIADEELWHVDSLVDILRERDGKEFADAAIETAARERPWLREMLDRAQQANDTRARNRTEPPRLNYAELKSSISNKGVYPFLWGKAATSEELEMAANDSIQETDRDRILAYLQVFRWRRFPGQIDRVLEFCKSEDERIVWAAVQLLSQIGDPRIRELALAFMDVPSRRAEGIKLLVSNYGEGDFQRIANSLLQTTGIDEVHALGWGVRDLIDVHCPAEAENSLLLLYEKGPCSLCRTHFVEKLIALNAIPEWMREECRFDADTDTRKLVQ